MKLSLAPGRGPSADDPNARRPFRERHQQQVLLLRIAQMAIYSASEIRCPRRLRPSCTKTPPAVVRMVALAPLTLHRTSDLRCFGRRGADATANSRAGSPLRIGLLPAYAIAEELRLGRVVRLIFARLRRACGLTPCCQSRARFTARSRNCSTLCARPSRLRRSRKRPTGAAVARAAFVRHDHERATIPHSTAPLTVVNRYETVRFQHHRGGDGVLGGDRGCDFRERLTPAEARVVQSEGTRRAPPTCQAPRRHIATAADLRFLPPAGS